ncbi:rhodanese-like domain-containing protein [Rubritalea profundi]|uniref:Rhodanese domain-containing protein n=1 Tax=Rubritalea profundi TaxID=1658618 RepID=A0A2S7U6A3_9BACT|nr:rhodanese-like domain-containing protein [Rubritalea profundi]PQJ30100.1 hypothetical protein BSZ32_17520 [Rubritalea profundi]
MKTISVISILIGGAVTSSCTSSLSELDKSDAESSATQVKEKQVAESAGAEKETAAPVVVSELPIEKVFELQQTGSILLIDTRSPIFYKLGHIDGAYSLPLKSFDKNFESSRSTLDAAVTKGKKIVIYCQSEKCPDSLKMARSLAKSGYKVSVFKGGWELWKMSGL